MTPDIQKRLFQHITGNCSEIGTPQKLDEFERGQSNPTYLITTDIGQFVLRRQPDGPLLKSAHAVDREYYIMNVLSETDVPVPRCFHLCLDVEVIGTKFFIMEYLPGRIFWNPALPEIDPKQRKQYYTEMSKVLASIHNVDISDEPLQSYGRPGSYFSRQLKRWAEQYAASELEKINEMHQLIEWLQDNLVEDDGLASIVHGDYRLDNLIFDTTSTKIIGVLDWELSTLGHPYSDLAYQCMQLRMKETDFIPGLGTKNRSELGLPTEQEYIELYCKHRSISGIKNWSYYLAFSFFRFAAILQGVKKRAVIGNAANPNADQLGALVQPLAFKALEIIENN